MFLLSVTCSHFTNLLSTAELVQAGSQVVLTCAYTVSPGQYIDSIKWYLNNAEVIPSPIYRVSQKKLGSQNFQIAVTHSFLKLKSIVIPLNQMSRSGEKHAQD